MVGQDDFMVAHIVVENVNSLLLVDSKIQPVCEMDDICNVYYYVFHAKDNNFMDDGTVGITEVDMV